jgi:hypothetical protein
MSGGSQPKDAYEADYIKTPGAVVHRDKNVAKGAVLAMVPMALIALLTTIMVAMGADPAAPPALAILTGLWFAWTLYMILTKVSVRTVLTSEMLEVHWGLSSTRIPVSAITQCHVERFEKGIPYATFAMKMWGPNGWLLVKWKDDSGKEKTTQVPAGEPGVLVEQIQRVRSSEAGAASELRVADETAEAEVEVLAEAEAAEATRDTEV